MAVYLDEMLAILTECGDSIDELCYSSDRDCANRPETRKKLTGACQKVVAATLALADKHALCDNVQIYIGDGTTPLTRLEVVRQMVNGSVCPDAFGETLELLGKRLRSGGYRHE